MCAPHHATELSAAIVEKAPKSTKCDAAQYRSAPEVALCSASLKVHRCLFYI